MIRRILIVLVSILFTISTICAVFGYFYKENNTNLVDDTNYNDNDNDKVEEWIKDVDLNSYSQRVITVLGSSFCSHCQEYKPVITKLAKEQNFKLYFFEIDSLSEYYLNLIKNKYNINFENAVPYTFVVKDNYLLCESVGFVDEEYTFNFINQYECNFYINNNSHNIDEEDPEENDESYEYFSFYDDKVVKNGKIDDCTISSIKGTKIELKDTVVTDGNVLSDLYINGKLSKKISFYSSPYNKCENYEPIEIDNDYFMISFVWGDIATIMPYNYLFNKNGKYISDFSSWKKKYAKEKGFEDVYGSVMENDEGGIKVVYYADEGMETDLLEAYCDLGAKPNDIYSISEYISIENDELRVNNVEKKTWSEVYMCKNDGESYCGDISKTKCSED